MITPSWTSAIAARRKHLTGLGKLPPPAARAPALRAVAILSLVAEAEILHALVPASTKPHLLIPAFTGTDPGVEQLLRELTETVASRARSLARQRQFSATTWLKAHGLDVLVLRSIGADDADLGALLAQAAQAVRRLTDKAQQLMIEHVRKLVARDAPTLLSTWETLGADGLGWILAHEHDGDPTRARRVARRAQALELYASLADRLRERAITAAIDAGQELVPVLAARIALTQPQIRALRQAAPLTEQHASYLDTTHEHAARQLQAHAVPLHQWPGGGRPAQQQAWASSPWLKSRALTLIRADYYGQDETVRDAIKGFRDDLLEPLSVALAKQHAIRSLRSHHTTLCDEAADMLKPKNFAPERLASIQSFLVCIHRALVGPRGPKAFAEAARLWHRRAASAAALRNENQTDRPGWPALCPPWTSSCGSIAIVPLTSAQALVEEGNAHQHCVGGYYDQCRSGNTQILSLRVHGAPAVTAEILLDRGLSSLRVGQFKGLRNQVPDDPALHQTMRDFLRDLRAGAHPLNLRELRAYRLWAAEHVTPWANGTLTLEHGRAVFPLYLPLLPRGTPPDFDRWCEASGLKAGLIVALRDLTAEPQALAA
jgi:hypothetical protein